MKRTNVESASLVGTGPHDDSSLSDRTDTDMSDVERAALITPPVEETPPPDDAGHGSHGVSADVCVLGECLFVY